MEKKTRKKVIVHSEPSINILSRRQPHSFPKVSTAESGIYVLPELCPLQTKRKHYHKHGEQRLCTACKLCRSFLVLVFVPYFANQQMACVTTDRGTKGMYRLRLQTECVREHTTTTTPANHNRLNNESKQFECPAYID
jgi:hypothetical protein